MTGLEAGFALIFSASVWTAAWYLVGHARGEAAGRRKTLHQNKRERDELRKRVVELEGRKRC